MPSNSRHRAMDIVSVRFGTEQIALIKEEAELEGVSASQFIRDAAYARAVLSAARRNATTVRMWDKLIAVVEVAGQDTLNAELREMLGDVQDEAERDHAT
jgi:uncharacterized protein (DUF1778 family)